MFHRSPALFPAEQGCQTRPRVLTLGRAGRRGGARVQVSQQEFQCCSMYKTTFSFLWHIYKFSRENKFTFSIFLFAVFLPHSLLSCSLIACSSLPKWIILSMAAWLPPHSWRLNWLESTSVSKTNRYFTTLHLEYNGEMNINCLQHFGRFI